MAPMSQPELVEGRRCGVRAGVPRACGFPAVPERPRADGMSGLRRGETEPPPEQGAPAKPRLRGRLHQVAFVVSIPAGIALDRTWGVTILGVAWAVAFGGIAVVILRHLAGRLGIAKLALLIVGGVLYTVGAVVLDRQRPDPSPAVFGYHEVWHAFTVAAGLCHYILIWLLVRAG